MNNDQPRAAEDSSEPKIDYNKIKSQIAEAQQIAMDRVEKSLDLMLSGNTIPFIARYRKETTGALDEDQLRQIQKQFQTNEALEKRKATVIALIEKQGKLTEDIRTKIQNAGTLLEVEDNYLPYKPKIKTLGAKAKERGLEPLAQLICEGKATGKIEDIVAPFIDPTKEIPTLKEALDGAMDIIAEDTASLPESRQFVREVVFKRNVVKTTANDDAIKGKIELKTENGKLVDPSIFEIYYDFSIEGTQLQNHQILALSRAEDLNVISVNFDTPDENMIQELQKQLTKGLAAENNPFLDYYKKAIENGFKRYVIRSIKREYWKSLRDKAERHAIDVFAQNLKNLLLTPPLKDKAIIGIDPGIRTGCKVAAIDQNGNFLGHGVIYPFPPANRPDEAKTILFNMAKSHSSYTIAIGNGTGSRETEQLVSELFKEARAKNMPFEYALVNEAGASIYSASEIAREEFPDLDLTVRGAISIARRLQDPLAELIKIDPKSIGVGMYQHDVNQSELKDELDAVIEHCVNAVGVNLNTASSKLLEYVSGINKKVSKEIIKYRQEKGDFYSRNQLLEIKGLGPKIFEQCAGFLKIPSAANPLDGTFVHPESYELTEKILDEVGLTPHELVDPQKRATVEEKLLSVKPNVIARKYAIEPEKVRYLVEQLLKPNLDPRDDIPPVILRQDVLSLDDLREGMIVKGTIRNVVDFGAFVDIGIKYNGLVHKSEISNQYVKDPSTFLSVGDVFDFLIIGLDKGRKRIQLSIKQAKQKTE